MDLSPCDLADRLEAVRTYVPDDFWAHFVDVNGVRHDKQEVILVSVETRDFICNILRDWK